MVIWPASNLGKFLDFSNFHISSWSKHPNQCHSFFEPDERPDFVYESGI